MSKLNDWVISSESHLRMWEVAMWIGLVVALSIGIVCTFRFLLHPEWVTGIPATLVFLFWAYLLVEGRKS